MKKMKKDEMKKRKTEKKIKERSLKDEKIEKRKKRITYMKQRESLLLKNQFY